MNKVCIKCKKEILPYDKFATLITNEGKKVVETIYFHFKCYLEWLNESITNKAKKMVSSAAGKAMHLTNKLMAQIQQ